ncbi:MAG TPA: diacylglycerol kinase family protein [Ktedonobacterales bacterium]|jgi:diacylglycerol kinase family enzyme|nr:diacylglycerol kinase family protein [Ktedonobacterales bacterium]
MAMEKRARQRVVLITSPRTGRMGATGEPAALLRRMGVEVTYELSVEESAKAVASGRRWKRFGVTAVVAAGGDGTIGAAAAHVIGTSLPLGILPLGTSNDIARSLGVPLDLEQAVEAIVGGAASEVDIGMVVTPDGQTTAASWRLDRLAQRLFSAVRSRRHPLTFLHAATLGLNVEFARLATDASRRARLGQFTYAASSVEALAKLQPVPVRLRLRDVCMPSSTRGDSIMQRELTVTCNALQLAVVNTPVFGGALNLRVPGVSASDHLLDFLVIEAPESGMLRGVVETLVAAFARLGEATTGTTVGLDSEDIAEATAMAPAAADGVVWPGVRRIQARSGRVETPTAVDVTLDGEIRTNTPFEATITPRPIRVLLPRDIQRAPAAVAVTTPTHNATPGV